MEETTPFPEVIFVRSTMLCMLAFHDGNENVKCIVLRARGWTKCTASCLTPGQPCEIGGTKNSKWEDGCQTPRLPLYSQVPRS